MMKKIISVLFISLFLVLPFRVDALELEKSFETSFEYSDNYYSYGIMNDYDDKGSVNGYIIFNEYYGDPLFVKYDLNNNLVYSKKDNIVNDLKFSYPNGKIVLNKINPDTNEVIWSVEYDESVKVANNKFYSYDENGNVDGYFIRLTKQSSNNTGFAQVQYVVKYDLDGKIVWEKKTKDINNTIYLKNDSGDLIRYSAGRAEHGFLSFSVYNETKNESIYSEFLGITSDAFLTTDGNSVICIVYVLSSTDGESTKRIIKFNNSGDKIMENELPFSINYSFLINSKTIFGDVDGFIFGAMDSNSNNFLLKYDYDGNLLWSKELSYRPIMISESYDSDGNFNGYIVAGHDGTSSSKAIYSYITKFTYPKRVIEAKNEEAEVPEDAYPGKSVSVKVKEKEGYIVKKIIVRDSFGNEIEVKDDGTFVMPDEDVSIDVIYEKRETSIITNPDTASAISAVLCLLVIIVSSTILIKYRRRD